MPSNHWISRWNKRHLRIGPCNCMKSYTREGTREAEDDKGDRCKKGVPGVGEIEEGRQLDRIRRLDYWIWTPKQATSGSTSIACILDAATINTCAFLTCRSGAF